MVNKKRLINLDIIRIVALILLISLHFFLKNNSGFYSTVIIDSPLEYLALSIRTISTCCIPIFLLITGYLKSNEELSKKYYKKLLKIIYVYIIAMVINYSFFHFWEGRDLSILSLIGDILLFRDSAWYIAMYLEFCLIIPFLNIIIKKINKKEYNILILSLMVMIVLPSVFNIWNFNNGFAGIIPPLPEVSYYHNLVSSFWISIYPIFYYFVGGYFKKFGNELSFKKNILFFIIALILSCSFNIYRFYGNVLKEELFLQYSGWECISISITLFMLLLRIKNVKCNFCEKIIIKFSSLELGAYLCSPVIERIIYYFFNSKTTDPMRIFKYFPFIIIIIFFGSMFISFIIQLIQKLIKTLINNIKLLILFSCVVISISFGIYYYKNNNWIRFSFIQILGNKEVGTLFDPFVFYDHDKYNLVVSNRKNNSIVLFESNNGYDWNNEYKVILSPEEDELLNRASIVKRDNAYYLYYTKQYKVNDILHSDIYLTIGEYNYDTNEFIFNSKRDLIINYKFIDNNDSVMNPSVLFDENEKMFKMWFAAGETVEPDVIYYATSVDGKKWISTVKPVFEKNNNINSFDYYKVGGPNVIKSNDKYVMLYVGYTDLDTGRVMRAISDDGINWERTNEVIIEPSLLGFDRKSVYKPTIIYNDKNNEWLLYYNGRNNGEYIGMYSCKKCILERK